MQDRNGRRLKEYHIEVVNDELIVTDEDGKFFEYKPNNPESQRVQEALFHEKQTIIENCLFGVDINPNSVKICRLRLWIELLKNAYYKTSDSTSDLRELETLPNIDINIKCGNSLVSRFSLDANLKQALQRKKWTIDTYRLAVATYRNAHNKEEKREMERLIADIKSDFRSEISLNDPKVKKLHKLQNELSTMTLHYGQLFEMNSKEKAEWDKKIKQLITEIKKLETEIEEIKSNKIFENAFEWRFEFPEVLNDEGDFLGFYVLLGNPPYIQLQSLKETSEQLKRFDYQTFEKTGDIYTLFYEKGIQLLKKQGFLCYITSNKWMRAGYGEKLRQYFLQHNPIILIDLGPGIFENATVDTNILLIQKAKNQEHLRALTLQRQHNEKVNIAEQLINHGVYLSKLSKDAWFIGSSAEQALKEKIERLGKPLKDWDVKIYYGIKTGLNEAFIIDSQKREEILNNCRTKDERKRTEAIIKPILRGRDIKRYHYEWAKLWVIIIPKGFTIKSIQDEGTKNTNIASEPIPRYGYFEYNKAWNYFEKNFHSLATYLLPFKEKAEKRDDKGDYWWELRACAYYSEFDKEKIVWQELAQGAQFSYDEQGTFFVSNTAYILTGNHLKYILGYLNSKWNVFSYDRWYCTKLGQSGTRWLNQHVQEIPIPPITKKNKAIVKQIEQLVDKILSAKKQNPKANTNEWESEIDKLVYLLYDLSEEEIKIVEKNREH